MAISVQPDSDESRELAGQFMVLATEIGNQLQAAVGDGSQPLPQNYWALRAKQTLLMVQITSWTNNDIQLNLDNAGQAVDSINQATQAMNDALKRSKTIAMDVAVVSSFVDLAVAISTGRPQEIISSGATFIGLLGKST